ncbi:MAG: hypothetical protein QM765_20135 [Myxococcales bacterium]
MFLGHYGLVFAAKRLAPRTSLGPLTFAGNLADTVWPVLLVLGVERVSLKPGLMAASDFDFESYPWSHSLLTGLLGGLAVALVAYALRHDLRAALVLGALVPSHWLLDLPFHRPDLPLWPGGPLLGLGLWSSVGATHALEALLFVGGLGVYLAQTRARDLVGTLGLWGMAGLLAAIYLASAMSPASPDADASAIGWAGLALWLFVPFAGWVDGHRMPRRQAVPAATTPSNG